MRDPSEPAAGRALRLVDLALFAAIALVLLALGLTAGRSVGAGEVHAAEAERPAAEARGR